MSYSKKIKNSLCFLSKSILICSALWIQSCSDDGEEPLDIDSQITFSNIAPAMEVWNNVPISLTVSDDKGIASVEILVNGVAITTLTQPPFETVWDASSTDDGVYTIKVVVTDKSGNKTEKETTVTVQNTLVTIDIASDQLEKGDSYQDRGFVFLSDENGNVIASTEYKNGDDVVLKSSTFTGTKFFLTEVIMSDWDGQNEVTMWTYPEIERGKAWTVFSDQEDDETYAGEANITGANLAANSVYMARSNGDEGYFDEFSNNSTIRITTAPSKLYVVRQSSLNEDGPVAYGLFSDITVGNNNINLAQVNKALTKITATVPEGAEYVSVEMKGYSVLGVFTNPYTIGYYYSNPDEPTFSISYPGNAFPTYYTEIGYSTENSYYYSGRNNTFYEITNIPNTVSFDFANEKLTYSASGEFDFITTTFETGEDEAYWALILPAGSNKVIPSFTLPDQLKTFDIPVFGPPSDYIVYEFDEIDGYDDLKAFIRTSSRSVDELYDDGKNYTEITYHSLTSPGGRSKTPKRSYSLRTALKK